MIDVEKFKEMLYLCREVNDYSQILHGVGKDKTKVVVRKIVDLHNQIKALQIEIDDE